MTFFWRRYSEITFLSLVPPAALEDIILRSSYTELLAGLNSELCSARVASVCLRLRVRGANRLRKPCCRRTFAIGGAVAGALLKETAKALRSHFAYAHATREQLEEWLFESAKLLQPHRVLAGFALLLCSMFHHVSAARSEQRAVLFSRTRSKRVPQARARRRIPKQPAHPLAGHSRFSRFTQRRLLLRERAHCPQMHARRRNC